jgi:hypothetical protein
MTPRLQTGPVSANLRNESRHSISQYCEMDPKHRRIQHSGMRLIPTVILYCQRRRPSASAGRACDHIGRFQARPGGQLCRGLSECRAANVAPLSRRLRQSRFLTAPLRSAGGGPAGATSCQIGIASALDQHVSFSAHAKGRPLAPAASPPDLDEADIEARQRRAARCASHHRSEGALPAGVRGPSASP